MHALISVKSGVRPDIVALVIQALPLVEFQELMETGESCIDNLVMLTEQITAGKTMDVAQLARRREEGIL